LEKPSWAPVVLSGALPRELPDFLVIIILGLASIEAALTLFQSNQTPLGPWILLLTVAPACTLASLSNSSRRQKEELALFAYGGAGWQIHLRYFLRGALVSAVGVSPVILRQAQLMGGFAPSQLTLVLVLVVIGGTFYAIPSIRRTRSLEFVEHFKG